MCLSIGNYPVYLHINLGRRRGSETRVILPE